MNTTIETNINTTTLYDDLLSRLQTTLAACDLVKGKEGDLFEFQHRNNTMQLEIRPKYERWNGAYNNNEVTIRLSTSYDSREVFRAATWNLKRYTNGGLRDVKLKGNQESDIQIALWVTRFEAKLIDIHNKCIRHLRAKENAAKEAKQAKATIKRLAKANGVEVHDDASGIWIDNISGRPDVSDGTLRFTDIRIQEYLTVEQVKAIHEIIKKGGK